MTAPGTAILQSQKLLCTEGLVVDLASRFDEILEMSAGKEVSQIHELAVVLILNVNNTPAILAASDLLDRKSVV